MDIVVAGGEVSARDVWDRMADAPSYATVRSLLRILMEKGYLKYRKEGRSYLYKPAQARVVIEQGALKRLLNTFYDGSVRAAIAGLLGHSDGRLESDEIEEIEKLLEQYSKKTKRNK